MSYLVALGCLALLSVVPGLARAALARAVGMRVVRVMVGFGPGLGVWRGARTTVQLHAIPFGVFSQVAGLHATDVPVPPGARDAFGGRPVWAQLVVLLAGAIGLFVASGVVRAVGDVVWGQPAEDESTVVVDRALPGKPAARAGVEADDEIVAVDGQRVSGVADVVPRLNATSGPLRLEIRRAGVTRTIVVVPEEVDGARRIGVQLSGGTTFRRMPLGSALRDGARFPVQYTRFLLGVIGQKVVGSGAHELAGPVGLVRMMSQRARMGAAQLAHLVAVLAVYASLLSWLLPVPPSDSARVLAWLWRRLAGTGAQPPAIDSGVIAIARPPVGPALVVMLTLLGLGVLSFGSVEVKGLRSAGLSVPMVIAFVGALRRRPLAWSFLRAVTPLFVASGILGVLAGGPPSTLLGVALWLAVTILLGTPAVRAAFGLRCPVCRGLDARAVLGAHNAFGCMACGSTWRSA
jgi:regulator of sigma E protease